MERYELGDDFLSYAYILDQNFVAKAIVDKFSSFVWTERYFGCGEFVLVIPVDETLVQLINLDDYVAIRESDVLMVIETMTLNTDEEQGDTITIQGRSLECLISRRIIWGKLEAKGSVQDAIKKAVTENAINPSDPNRKIPGLVFKDSTDQYVLDQTEEEIKMVGDNLYEAIYGLCQSHRMGFRVRHVGDKVLEFELYHGTDRTEDQDAVAPVVFSSSYENLLSSEYIQSEVNYASNALVKGDKDTVFMEVRRNPERTGLKRRELFIEIGDAPENQGSYTQKYWDQMFTKAKEVMMEHVVTIAFGSEVAPMVQFAYGVDYFIGDIVQVRNQYGFAGRCRIDELVRTRDDSGINMVPTFIAVDTDEKEVTT